MVGRLRLRWTVGNPNSYNLPNMADALIYGITFFRAQFLLFGNSGMKSEFFSALYRVGYDGPVIIEHEDRRFEGTDEKVKRGFLLARDVLQPYVK